MTQTTQTPSVAEQLMANKGIASLSRNDRDAIFDKMIEESHNNPAYNRGELEQIRNNAMKLKFDMAKMARDLDYTKLPSQTFYMDSDMSVPEESNNYYMSTEEWEALTPQAQFNLYKTHLDSYGSNDLRMLGHRLKDIGVATITPDTYAKMGSIVADGVKGFVSNLPEYAVRAGIRQAEVEAVDTGMLTDEQAVMIAATAEEQLAASEKRSDELWKSITQESFEQWDAYKKTNPYGIDFVQNRLIDVAVGIPFGLYGAGIRAGLGATALEVGRSAIAPVVSSAAQGVAFEWAFDKIDQGMQESADWQAMSEEQKAGMRVLALGISLVASVPVDGRVQSLIAGKTGADIVQAGVNAVKDNKALVDRINTIAVEAQAANADIVSAIAKSPEVTKGIQEAMTRSGAAPADLALESVAESLELAANRMNLLKVGEAVDTTVDDSITSAITVYNSGPVPISVKARNAVEQDVSSRLSAIEDIEKQIPHLEQEAANNVARGNVEEAAYRDAEIEQLKEEALRNVVVREDVKARTAKKIQAEARAAKDPEVKRQLIAEWARVATPMERAKALAQYDAAERAIIKNLEEIGVIADIPLIPGSNNYLSPYPMGRGNIGDANYIPPWKYTKTRNLSDAESKKMQELISKHHTLTYDRAPLRNYKAYREAAGQGGYLPGQAGPRPEFETTTALDNITDATKNDVTDANKEIKELDLPTEVELIPTADEAAIADNLVQPVPGEAVVTQALKERWERRLGRALTDQEVTAAVSRTRKLFERVLKEVEDAPIFSYLETGDTVFSIAALERMFPTLKGAFSNAMEALAVDRVLLKDGLVTQDAVMQFMKNIWRSVNINNIPGWYEKMRPMIESADQMWDYVKGVSQKAPKQDALDNFFSELKKRAKGTELTVTNINAAKEQIKRMFPNFDASLMFDPTMKGAGQFDEVTKSIILNPDKLNPRTLMHETGHYYFTHVLTSNERMAFLDSLRPLISNTTAFAEAFPEIALSLTKADEVARELGSRGAQYVAYRLDPAELFADSWTNFLENGRVPSLTTMDAFGEMFRGMGEFSKQSKAIWNKMPEVTKKIMSMLSIGPTPEQIGKMLEEQRQSLKEAAISRFVVDGNIEDRVNSIYNDLSIKYGGVEVAGGDFAATLTPDSRSKIFSGERKASLEKAALETSSSAIYGEGFTPDIWTLTPVQQIALIERNVEDLMQYAEMHTLRMLNGDSSSLEAAELAYKKLDQQFGGQKVAERNLKNAQAATDRFKLYQEEFEWDAVTGEPIDQTVNISGGRIAAERMEFEKYKEHAIRANEYANRKVAEAVQLRKDEAKLRSNQTVASGQRLANELAELKEAMQNSSGPRLKVMQNQANEIEVSLNNLRNRYSSEKKAEPIQPVPLTKDEIKAIRAEAYKEFNADMEVSNVVEIAAKLADEKVPSTLTPAAKDAWEREFMMRAAYLNKGLSGNEMITTDIRLNEAARLGEYVMLKQMHNHAKADLGLVDFADSGWYARQEMAQHLVDQWHDTSLKGQIFNSVFSKPISKTVRYAGAVTLGWDQAEDGTWFISPTMLKERLVSAPWLAWLLPGGRFLTQQVIKGGKSIGTSVLKKTSLKTQQIATNMWDSLKFNWLEYRGNKELEFIRRAAIRTAGTIRQESQDLGGQLNLMFPVKGVDKEIAKINREIRSDLMKVVENTVDAKEIVAKWAREKPDLMYTAEKIHEFYRKYTEYLIRRGAILDTNNVYINKVFDSVSAMTPKEIKFRSKTLRGLKLPHTQETGASFDIVPYKSPGKVSINGEEANALFAEPSLGNMIADSRNTGELIVVGDKVNVYRKTDSELLYTAIQGSPLDSKYAEMFQPYAVWDSTSRSKGFTVSKIGRYSQSNTPKVTIKRPFTTSEEELAGNSFDAALKTTAFGERLEKDFAKADVYYRLAEQAKKTSDYAINFNSNKTHVSIDGQMMRGEDAIKLLKKRGWQLLDFSQSKEGVYKYGALRGHFVSPETYRMLSTFEQGSLIADLRKASKSIDYYIKNVQFFKRNKTILNMPTHALNFIANGTQGVLAGRNPLQDLMHGAGMMHARQLENNYRKARIALDGSVEKEKVMQEAFQKMVSHPYHSALRDARLARIADSALVNSEFSYSELYRMLLEMQDTSTMGTLDKLKDITLGRLARGWAKTNEFARHMYESEDLIYKLGGFYTDTVLKGKSMDESLESIYAAYFDYGNLPNGIAGLRDAGIVPFISYMYKALPAMMKGIYEKPERLAGVLLAIEGFNMMMAANDYGISDAKEMREIQRQIFNERRSRTVWGIPSQIYLGGSYEKDADNNDRWVSQYLDIGKYIPGAGPVESTGFDNLGAKAPKDMAGFLFSSNPIINILSTMWSGKDPGLNMPVEGFGEIAKHAWRTYVPNIPIPYSGTRGGDLIQDSLVDMGLMSPSEKHTGFTRQGIAKSGQTSVAQAILGITIARVDDGDEARQRVLEKKYEIDKLVKKAKSSIREPGLPETDRTRIQNRLIEDVSEILPKVQKAQKALTRYQELRARYQTAKVGTGLPQP